MKRFTAVCVLILLAGCGGRLWDLTNPFASSSGGTEGSFHLADASIPSGALAITAATNWTDPIGSIASIDTAGGYTVTQALATTDSSDVVLRSFNGRIFIINRFGTDTIQVVAPTDFGIVANYSVGGGSNPQDIWVASEEKAYVSRLDAQNDGEIQDDIIIINPLTGERLSSIDFKSYMNADRDVLSRAAQMTAVGKRLFICLEDLPSNMLEGANASGKVAVVDMDTDEIVSVITLAGRNPVDITYSSLTNLVYVANAGVFDNFATDVTDPYGGIEIIDPEALTTSGIVVDDASLGAYPGAIRLSSDTLGFASVGDNTIASFNPTSYEVINPSFYTISGFFMPDFSIDDNGNLLITETAADNAGVVVVNPSDGSTVSGPQAVGAQPTSITFVDVN